MNWNPFKISTLSFKLSLVIILAFMVLLVVVTIIALFAALVGPRLFQQVDRSRVTAARAQINSFQTALGI